MSEAELHFMRARLIGGRLSKARRGELQMGLPVGLVCDPKGKVVLDPDTGVQQAIRHVFTLFTRTGSARAVVQQFNADGLLFPVRVRTGARKGELAWMPLQHWRVLRTLHNPRYAGAFAYGRRRERLNSTGKKTLETLTREQWIALIPDAHPGYISWDQYEINQKLLLGNATAHGKIAPPPSGGYLRNPGRESWLAGAVARCQVGDETFPASARTTCGTRRRRWRSRRAPTPRWRMLGHSSAAMTLDVYADLFELDLDAVAESVQNVSTVGLSAPLFDLENVSTSELGVP